MMIIVHFSVKIVKINGQNPKLQFTKIIAAPINYIVTVKLNLLNSKINIMYMFYLKALWFSVYQLIIDIRGL